MEKFAELFAEHWSNFSRTTLVTTPLSIDAHDFEKLQENWAQPAYGVGISFNDEAVTGMLIFDRTELLTLLMDILGSGDEAVADRELTPVESSLCELIFEQAASNMVDGWPQQAPLAYEVGELFGQPNRSRMFAPDKKMLVSGLCIQLPQSSVNLELILAKDEAAKLLGVQKQKVAQPNPNNRISHEKIAEIDVGISARLGSAELAMTDLVSIACGDIIVFEQRIEEPVIVFANEEPLFHAWPGRTANKQSLKIVSISG